MNPESMDNLFQALASASRREMMAIVRDAPGCSIAHVCSHFGMSRIAVMKHLNILESAGLLASEKHGRTRQLYFNAAPLQAMHECLTSEYNMGRASRSMEFRRTAGSK